MKIRTLIISGLLCSAMVSCSSFSGTSNADKTVLQSDRPEVVETGTENQNQMLNENETEVITPMKMLGQSYGTYEGTLPCPDCEGIVISLFIGENNVYQIEGKYIGKDDRFPFSSGTYSFDESSSIITLQDLRNFPKKYLLKTDKLVQLDENGNLPAGNNEQTYTLLKLD